MNFLVGVELYHAARCVCFGCGGQIIEYGSRKWSRHFAPNRNRDVEVNLHGATVRARIHDLCLESGAEILVPAMICEACEYIGQQAEFLPRAGTATVPNPPTCPRCRSTNLSQGETEKEISQ